MNRRTQGGMKCSWKIAAVTGIGIYVHATFWLIASARSGSV
jgi:hypothetical protein